MRPQCKYVHLLEDFVEEKNGYISVCKEAILGNCSKNKCKFYHICTEELQRQILSFQYNKTWRSNNNVLTTTTVTATKNHSY
ncbi:unnamed protein product [Rotaria socialis]